jgi:hypothetical protein
MYGVSDRGYADFRECNTAEIPRIPLPGSRVNSARLGSHVPTGRGTGPRRGRYPLLRLCTRSGLRSPDLSRPTSYGAYDGGL